VSIVLDEAALRHFTHSTFGPVGIMCTVRTHRVFERAVQNASGAYLDRRSGQLVDRMRERVFGTPTGVVGVVSTNALSTWHGGPFSYPSYLERYGGPHGRGLHWMSDALKEAIV
jgi:hypothetical protein